jgi:competence protein ComEA
MINLTPQEKKVVLFIVWVWLCGLGIELCLKNVPASAAILKLQPHFGKVDLNTADRALLEQLPGVGEKLAERIILLRSEVKRLRSVEELKKVRGLHNRTFDQIKDLVYAD